MCVYINIRICICRAHIGIYWDPGIQGLGYRECRVICRLCREYVGIIYIYTPYIGVVWLYRDYRAWETGMILQDDVGITGHILGCIGFIGVM